MTNDANNRILAKLDGLTHEIKVLRSDVSDSKTNTTMMSLRLHTLEDGNKAIQTDIADIKQDIRRLEVLHEETDNTINQISENVAPIMETVSELKETTTSHEDRLAQHNRRLNFLEKTA